jgi:glutamine amidotransferase
VGIVDVAFGNINSIYNGLLAVGVTPKRATTASEIAAADKLILPGVGHFRAAKERLKMLGLFDALHFAVTEQEKPILGICLGLQLMCERSQEGDETGFGWIKADVVKFQSEPGLDRKVPHISWNTLDVTRPGSILAGVDSGSECFFSHSYYLSGLSDCDVLATTDYGQAFPSVVQRAHVHGTQFHPEKSGKTGLKVLRNFVVSQ